MILYELVLELTRRCNMRCEHCLRGKAQNKDLDILTVEKFLVDNKIRVISHITFTGGEPSLRPDIITDFIKICLKHNITLRSFYIATNGKCWNEEFLNAIKTLYNFCGRCTNVYDSLVEISRSIFHKDQDEEWIERLNSLRFVKEKKELNQDHLVNEGKAKVINKSDNLNREGVYIWEPTDMKDFNGEVYLNVKGDICTSCDLSYRRQDARKLGSVSDQNLTEMGFK